MPELPEVETVRRTLENFILNKAILQGGTTIHSFSANGIDGLFQVQLKVHMQKH